MILVLLGTSPYPFRRLLEAVAAFATAHKEEVIAQSGHTPCLSNIECIPFLNHNDLLQLIKNADVVIAQGGFGSLRDSIASGARIVAVPRFARHGEALHDQSELVDALAEEGLLVPLEDVSDLANAIQNARNLPPPALKTSRLQSHLAGAICELLRNQT